MVRSARLIVPFLAWLFVAGVLVQVFLAGLALFADAERWRLHVDVGWLLHLAPVLLLIVVAVSRPPRATLWTAIALAVVTFVQPLLATLRGRVPTAAALHPVFALLVFSLGIGLALQLSGRLRAERAATGSPTPPPATAAAP